MQVFTFFSCLSTHCDVCQKIKEIRESEKLIKLQISSAWQAKTSADVASGGAGVFGECQAKLLTSSEPTRTASTNKNTHKK